MTTRSTERRGEFEFYLIVKAHTPVVTFSMVMYLQSGSYRYIRGHNTEVVAATSFTFGDKLFFPIPQHYWLYTQHGIECKKTKKNIEFSKRTF